MSRNISDLRETMFDTLEKLKAGAITVEQAKAISDIGQKITNSAKVGDVTCGGKSAQKEMLRNGHAWVYDRHMRDRGLYELRDQAKAARAGLWSRGDAVPPWEFRQRQRGTGK